MLCFCLTQLTGQDLGSVQAEVVHEVCDGDSLRLRGQDGDSLVRLRSVLSLISNQILKKKFLFRSVYLG